MTTKPPVRESFGRVFHNTNSNYSLPNDEKEHNRLNLQHEALKYLTGANYFAPLSGHHDGVRNILDLGCGSGSWVFDISREFPEAEVIGADMSIPESAISAPKNLKFIQIDITSVFPFPDNSFDFVQMRIVPSIAHRDPILLEIWRVLRPGGFVTFVEPGRVFSSALQTRTPAFKEADDLLELSPHAPRSQTGEERTWSIAHLIAEMIRDVKDTQGQTLFERTDSKVFNIPIGDWPEDPEEATHGGMMASVQISLLEGFGPKYVERGLTTEEDFASLRERAIAELADHGLKLQAPFVYAWAQKQARST